MSTINMEELVARLDPDGRGGRRHVDDVADAIRGLLPHIDAAEVPELIRNTIKLGESEGRWSATRGATVRRGLVTLPRSISLRFTGQPVDRLRPVGVPLRGELAPWAATLPMSTTQRDLIIDR
jgi:hypothetical protein